MGLGPILTLISLLHEAVLVPRLRYVDLYVHAV